MLHAGSGRSRSARGADDDKFYDNRADDRIRGYVGSSDGGRSRVRGSDYRHEWPSKFEPAGAALPEDPRISKLLRRLCAETDVEKSLQLCDRLQDAVMLPDNARYVQRSHVLLADSLLSVLYDGPGPETKRAAAAALGRIGYVTGPEFSHHLDWIISNYAVNHSSIKHLLTLSLLETFQLDFQSCSLNMHVQPVLQHLQTVVEGTNSAEVFMAAVNTMIVLSNSYPETFSNHFVDTVDILVGWHVDNDQQKIKQFALQSLYKLSRHWQVNVEFSINLLNHFVEDMIAYGDNVNTEKPNDEEPVSVEDSVQKVTSLINVFNTVVKSLGSLLNPSVSQVVSWSFLTECMAKVIDVMIKLLKEDSTADLLLAGNECISLILEHLQTKTSSCAPQLYTLVYLEVEHYLNIQDQVCLSIIHLIGKVIKEISSNLPLEFITEIIGKKSLVRPLRYSTNPLILQAVVTVYSNLLNLKNIPLLQETYKYVLCDIHNCFSLLIPDIHIIQTDYTEIVSQEDAQKNIIFYLQCLSDLANASNSIIGMWALKPSILELLAVKMCPHNNELILLYPALHYAITYLLYSHCKKNNHFIASSDLVTSSQQRASDIFGFPNLTLGDVSSSSPTSGHLAVILNLLSIMLDKDMYKETLLLILHWISDILCQLDKYFPLVSMTQGFLVLITNMLNLAYTFYGDIVIMVMKNAMLLLKNKEVNWNIIILKNIATLSILHIDNRNSTVRDMCLQTLFNLPWDVVQLELDKHLITVFVTGKFTLNIINTDTKMNAFKDYLMSGSFTTLSTEHFKIISDYLFQLSFEDKTALQNAFLTFWPLQSQDPEENNNPFFRQCAMSFSSIIVGWMLSELAQSCINLKLRTPLGKPQETFMKIESALKSIARDTSSLDPKYVATEYYSLREIIEMEQIRSRWLAEFMIFLEKYIYNAAEGTAVVLPNIGKPVRTFFHTNWSTCREWLSRVRPAALAVSLYAGHIGASVYHSGLILQSINLSTTTTVDIEAIAMSLARVVIKLQEPEVLHGLYVWIKKTFDKKYQWLKAAAEQANSRYEVSIDYYKKLSNDFNVQCEDMDTISVPENNKTIRFINEQVTECYKHIQNWEDMQHWLENTQQDKCRSEWQSYVTLNKYENNMDISSELSNWDVLNMEAKEISKNVCSSQGLINKIESTLIHTAISMTYADNIELYDGVLFECENILKTNMIEFSRNNSVHFMKELAVMQLANQGLRDMIKVGKVIQNPFRPSSIKDQRLGTNLQNLSRVLWWNQYFTKMNTTEENTFYVDCLRLDLIKCARKNSNLMMAKRELMKYFNSNSLFQIYIGNLSSLDELSDILIMSTNTYDMDVWSPNNAAALVELCKLTYAQEDVKSRAINLCASISLGFSQRLAMCEQNYELREKGTRMLLTLSKWVQNEDESILIKNIESPLTKLVTALPEIGLVDNNVSENVIPLSDSAVGKLLQFSVNQCPGLAKAWSNFASWCFRWGRKMVEFSSKTGEQLTDNDKMQIRSVMIGCSPQDFEAVCEILSKTKATYDDEEIDWNEINTSEMIESQLRTVPCLSNAYPDHLILLVDIWKQAQKRVFSYYELSADAYFKFLQLICAADYINHSGEYAVVSATLRLLRLIVKHAMELQTVLESGLANTPTQPWKVIIPQLFSRLNHPEKYVRKCVSDLLCRLAEDTPHLITFPAVVGAVENESHEIAEFNIARTFLSNEAEYVGQNLDLNESESDKVVNNELNSCFLDMVETLTNQAPKTIQQVKLLVKELQRINLLWDELWLGTLVQHHTEFMKKLTHLEAEILKVKNNTNLTSEDKDNLIKEKYRIIFDPIIYVLQQLNHITSAKPETPHEFAFQKKFQALIDDVINKLNNPTNPDKPQDSWAPLKQLQIKFHQKVNRRTSYILKMSDISPILAELNNTVITMPGVHTTQRTVRVTIKSVENNVAILPTKTRPKKLVFRGSDGKSYIYLFKGLEDLHLDERIMQFLSIVNTMMARDSENDCNQTYRARHYSVIPLGPRSGLISWVDNVTPLFALYKRWQNREVAMISAKTNKTVSVLRPSELFYNKLNPLLQEAGIPFENRKEWPVSILKQVLQELTAETPNDLLWRELWCGSVSPEHWWRTIRRYSYSVAVMSTIGYIIGLGDRHLDNVLVDLSSGEVVHIDYNVCFEKGKTLRVPEKVPFRMTPNLVTALGVTGVEGIFRLSCEHVLRVMRRGRETLLTLLEAFVYDPLVEWGGAGGGGGAGAGTGGGAGGSVAAPGRRRRGGAAGGVKAALAMLAVRAQEHKQDLADNTSQFLSVLPEMKTCAETWVREHEALASVEDRLAESARQLALVREIRAAGPALDTHPLHAVSQRYSAYKRAKNAREDSLRALRTILGDFDSRLADFAAAEEELAGPRLQLWCRDLAPDRDEPPIFAHIHEFLTNAGQAGTVAHCERAERELRRFAGLARAHLRASLDLLERHAAVALYYPRGHTESSRLQLYRDWIAAALDCSEPDAPREATARLDLLLERDEADRAAARLALERNYRLRTLAAEADARLETARARLDAVGGNDGVAAARERHRRARADLAEWLRGRDGDPRALEAAIAPALCSTLNRVLTLEARARSAGDFLAELAARDGRLFPNELCAELALGAELAALAGAGGAGGAGGARGAACAVGVHEAAREVALLVRGGEGTVGALLAALHEERPDELRAAATLRTATDAAPLPPLELAALLQGETADEVPLRAALELRAQYAAAVESSEAIRELDSRFCSLETRCRELRESRPGPPGPTLLKITQVRQSAQLCGPEPTVRDELPAVLRRIHAVSEVVRLAAEWAETAARPSPLPPALTEHDLLKPLRSVCADVVSRHVIGTGSRALCEVACWLLQRGLDLRREVDHNEIGASWNIPMESLCEKLSAARGGAVRTASVLVRAVERARIEAERCAELLREADDAAADQRAARLRLAAHTQLHHELVGGATVSESTKLGRRARELAAATEKLSTAHDRAQTLLASVHQRLKWGAGANPLLRPVVEALERSWGAAAREVTSLVHAGGVVAATARAAAGLRARHTGHANTARQALAHWEKACALANKYSLQVSPVEESLMEMLHPEGSIDDQWVENVSALVREMSSSLQSEWSLVHERLSAATSALRAVAATLVAPAAAHDRLVADLRPELVDLQLANDGNNPAATALSEEKRVRGLLQLVCTAGAADADSAVTAESVRAVSLAAGTLLEDLPRLHSQLAQIHIVWAAETGARKLTRQGAVLSSKTNNNKHGGCRSAQGAGVWKRVRLKLEGRDLHLTGRAALHDQVEYMISEAMNTENLCLMYEGWMAWV